MNLSRYISAARGAYAQGAALFRGRALTIRERALGTESRYRGEPQQPRWLASWIGRLDAGAAALRARACYLREGARPPHLPITRGEPQQPPLLLRTRVISPGAAPLRAPRWRSPKRSGPTTIPRPREAQQPRAVAQARGDPRRGAVALLARAGYLREGAGPTSGYRPEPQQPRPPASDQGYLVGRGRLVERALAIREKVSVRDIPITADSLNNLAGLLGQGVSPLPRLSC